MRKLALLPVLAGCCCLGPVAHAAAADRDHDRLPDRWERRHQLSTTLRSGLRDPDRDGLTNIRELRHRTNPRRKDTDRDGLRDGAEISRYHTNPRRKDTDRDGYSDGAEVRAGSNPRRKSSVPRSLLAPLPAPATGGGTGSVLGVPSPTTPGASGASTGSGSGSGSGSSPAAGPPSSPGAPATLPPATCDRAATTGTLSSELNAASAGQTICLATGDYGTFTGARKTGPVTVMPQPGATVTMRVAYTSAQNVVLNGVAVREASMSGSTRDVTIKNSVFSGPISIDGVANANILLDHNSHLNIDAGGQFDAPARIHLPYSSSTPSGVTVQNSLLAGGDSDGIQAGTGLNILNNEFRDILESGSNHTDGIQLLRAAGTVVRGNWLHATATGIVAYDGVERATIEDNVVDLGQAGKRPWGIELYSDNGSIIRHNTVRYATGCSFNQPCGMIALDRKPEDPAGSGTVVVDNVATEIAIQNGSTAATRKGNMLRRSARTGDFVGTPSFAAGANPASWAGFLLAGGSAGRAAASDGLDVGIRG